MLQREVNAGGCDPKGGLLTLAARIGLSEYQSFRARHPGMSRAQLSAQWRRYKTGGSQLGGALLGGYPGERKEFAQLSPDLSKDALKATRKALRERYEERNPGWREEKAYYVKPRAAGQTRGKQAAALYKQMRAYSSLQPQCPPYGLTARESYNYDRLREAAQALGIESEPLRVRIKQTPEQAKAKRRERAARAAMAKLELAGEEDEE